MDLQAYLKTQYLAFSKEESSLTGVVSRFDSSKSSGRSKDRENYSRRHTYGTSLERLVTLYFVMPINVM